MPGYRCLAVYLGLLLLLFFASAGYAKGEDRFSHGVPLVENLVGEHLEYDISFMWFERLATGSISLEATDYPGRYLIAMQAQTRGMAALFTRNRTEKFETLVDIGDDGQLRPLLHSSYRITWRNPDAKSERIVRYHFDYNAGTIYYERIRNGEVRKGEWFDLDLDNPSYDILSALYNLRLGYFGTLDQEQILIPTFHHRGAQEIIVEPFSNPGSSERRFFDEGTILYRVLIDPEVFGTTSRDVYVAFDENMRLQRGIIKRMVGLGDLRGVLVSH